MSTKQDKVFRGLSNLSLAALLAASGALSACGGSSDGAESGAENGMEETEDGGTEEDSGSESESESESGSESESDSSSESESDTGSGDGDSDTTGGDGDSTGGDGDSTGGDGDNTGGDGDTTGGDGDSTGGDGDSTGGDGDTTGGDGDTTGGDGDTTGGDGDTGSTDTIPYVVSTMPADGELGVGVDTTISVTFSEPMNTASVEAAYEAYTDGIFGNQVSFSWNGDNTALVIDPGQDLVMNAGDETVQAKIYEWSIAGAAEDAEGTAMGADYDSDFFTPRDITESINVVSSMTATVRKNGNSQTTQNDDCFAGGYHDGSAFYCGLTWDLDDLTHEPTQILEADAIFYLTVAWNNPWGTNGIPASLWNASFSSVVEIPPPPLVFTGNKVSDMWISTNAQEGTWDVTDFVLADWNVADGNRTQFRIQAGSNDDGITAYWDHQFDDDYPLLEVNYLAD